VCVCVNSINIHKCSQQASCNMLVPQNAIWHIQPPTQPHVHTTTHAQGYMLLLHQTLSVRNR
jgi:hypothetical protein